MVIMHQRSLVFLGCETIIRSIRRVRNDGCFNLEIKKLLGLIEIISFLGVLLPLPLFFFFFTFVFCCCFHLYPNLICWVLKDLIVAVVFMA
jgi:hypothetical protein